MHGDERSAGGLNEFYGSERQLREYHTRFLPFLEAGPAGLPVLDLGCGSGVFLELARERGMSARGVELAREAAAVCAAKGLDVIEGEVRAILTQTGSESVRGIYCCHLIEHLGYEDACGLLRDAGRTLAPKGRVVVITPNPASLSVIGETFWLDPTHVRPYPLPLLERMMERAGLRVIARGHDDPPMLPRREWPRRVWLRLALGKFYGPMNTFVVGMKEEGK